MVVDVFLASLIICIKESRFIITILFSSRLLCNQLWLIGLISLLMNGFFGDSVCFFRGSVPSLWSEMGSLIRIWCILFFHISRSMTLLLPPCNLVSIWFIVYVNFYSILVEIYWFEYGCLIKWSVLNVVSYVDLEAGLMTSLTVLLELILYHLSLKFFLHVTPASSVTNHGCVRNSELLERILTSPNIRIGKTLVWVCTILENTRAVVQQTWRMHPPFHCLWYPHAL